MAYRVHQNGTVECDTAEELMDLAKLGLIGNGTPPKSAPVRKGVGRQSEAIKESWEKARKLAKKEGISVKEARSKLKKEE